MPSPPPLYPIALKMEGRRVLVVGGGAAAAQKVRGLLKAKASVTVVAPKLNSTLHRLWSEGKVKWKQKRFSPSVLKGTDLVFAATNDKAVQKHVCTEARRRKLWVNVTDVPELCDFYAVSFERHGPLLLSISTSGSAPALSRFLRRRWHQDILAAAAYLKWLAPARAKLKHRTPVSAKVRRLVDAQVFELLRQGRAREARESFKKLPASQSRGA